MKNIKTIELCGAVFLVFSFTMQIRDAYATERAGMYLNTGALWLDPYGDAEDWAKSIAAFDLSLKYRFRQWLVPGFSLTVAPPFTTREKHVKGILYLSVDNSFYLSRRAFQPYITLGFDFYNYYRESTFTGVTRTHTSRGINLGGGFDFPFFGTLQGNAEARVHSSNSGNGAMMQFMAYRMGIVIPMTHGGK